MSEASTPGIACGSCGTILPTEWIDEPRDKRTPCPKCRGTQRRTAIAKPERRVEEKPPGLFGRIAKFMKGGG